MTKIIPTQQSPSLSYCWATVHTRSVSESYRCHQTPLAYIKTSRTTRIVSITRTTSIMQIISTSLLPLLLLSAVHKAECYNHGLPTSSYSAIFRNNARGIKNTVNTVESQRSNMGAEHSSGRSGERSSGKNTALYSLGDPDTNGESTFYRW